MLFFNKGAAQTVTATPASAGKIASDNGDCRPTPAKVTLGGGYRLPGEGKVTLGGGYRLPVRSA